MHEVWGLQEKQPWPLFCQLPGFLITFNFFISIPFRAERHRYGEKFARQTVNDRSLNLCWVGDSLSTSPSGKGWAGLVSVCPQEAPALFLSGGIAETTLPAAATFHICPGLLRLFMSFLKETGLSLRC